MDKSLAQYSKSGWRIGSYVVHARRGLLIVRGLADSPGNFPFDQCRGCFFLKFQTANSQSLPRGDRFSATARPSGSPVWPAYGGSTKSGMTAPHARVGTLGSFCGQPAVRSLSQSVSR
jgi:hypothetical protein